MNHTLRKRLFRILPPLLVVIATSGCIAVIAQRQTQLRGVLQGFPSLDTPPRVPILGVNADLTQYDEQALDENLDLINETGFVWVRQTFYWDEIERVRGQYDWEVYDSLVAAASTRGLHLVAVFGESPSWAAPTPESPPDDLTTFASFTAAVASRYGDRIDVYQIWDEPNLSSGWGGQPDVIAYAALLEGAYRAIHAADNKALVLTAGLAPTTETGPDNLSDLLFLHALYENGAAPFFDGVAGKPYGFDTGPEDRRANANLLNFSHFILLREEMVKQGDSSKPLWGTQFGWNALPSDWSGTPSFWGLTTPQTQAAWVVNAYQRALNEWPWSGALILENWQPSRNTSNDNPRWGFALRDQNSALTLTAEALHDHSEQFNEALWPGLYPANTDLARYSGLWKFSDLGADIVEEGGSVVDIPFRSDSMGIIARRDHYRAYLYVQIDGQPSRVLPHDERGAYAVLTSPDYHPRVEVLPLAGNLNPAETHLAHIEAERGWDQWAVAGYVVGHTITTLPYDALIVALAALALAGIALTSRLRNREDQHSGLAILDGLRHRVSEGVHLALSIIAALALWLGMAITWGGVMPSLLRRLGDGPSLLLTALTAGVFYYSPWFLLTILALIALFALIYARLDIGLALIMFFTPYYLLPRPLFDRALSLVEVLSLLVLLAWMTRVIEDWRQSGWPSLTTVYQRMTPLDKAVSLFVAVAIVSISWADLIGVAITDLRQMLIEPGVMYLVLRTIPMTGKSRWRIVDLLILTGVIISAIGFYQLVTGTDLITAEAGITRMQSVFGTPNNLALNLGRLIPIAASVFLISDHPLRRWLYGAAGFVMIVATVLTLSKGALLLGLPVGLALVVILWAGRRGLIAVGVGFGALAAALIPLSRVPRFQSLFDFESGSSFFRVQLWQSALRMLADHPITGVGLDQFLYQYRGHYILPVAWEQPDLSQPHNFLLNYWIRLGIIGLAAGIWIQIAFWNLAWQVQKSLQDTDSAGRALVVGLMGSMAAFIAHGMVDEVHFVIDLAFIFFMTLGLMHQINETGNKSTAMAEDATQRGV